MIDYSKIKLIIWDLDETLWNGTLSEGEVTMPNKHYELINILTDRGIINSICSKNNLSDVENKLNELSIREQFVFMSVNWNPKGSRIKDIIKNMQLRDVNVLFIDDNHSNLEEAKFNCPNIMTAKPEEIDALYEHFKSIPATDLAHKRLNQYKVLETKYEESSNYSSNEEFLKSSNITLKIDYDCISHLDRIHDLVWRSNQLNFTKVRSTKEELSDLFNNKNINCGYVTVSDKFGDYGLVGFFAIENEKCLHFCFSCRTLGMGIEQYVYNTLNRPELNIVGEVISDLTSTKIPSWINQKSDNNHNSGGVAVSAKPHSVLIKGPCDLFQILPYIADKSIIDTDFTHTNSQGVTIESTGHTTHIVNSLGLSDEQKKLLTNEIPFTDDDLFLDKINMHGYKLLIISILADANLGVYKRKLTGEKVAFLEGFHPITNRDYWDSYINGEFNCASFKFTKEFLEKFEKEYEFVGINTPEMILENITYIKNHIPKDCTLAVMLGGELYYEKNTFPAYENRHIVHKQINDLLRSNAESLGIKLIDVNNYLKGQDSFYDHFNHYIKPVYYALAGEIVELINETCGAAIKETGKLKMVQIRAKEALAPLYYKLRKLIK